MARIAVDIDSTLYDFEIPVRDGFLKLAEETGDKSYFRGAYHPWTEWRSPSDACGREAWLEVVHRCHEDDSIIQQTPFPNAAKTLTALVDSGHDLLYISNRKTESAEATHQWLVANDFPLADGDHELVCMEASKVPYMADCQYLIDDRPKTLVEFVYDQTWRRRLEKTGETSWGSSYTSPGVLNPRKAFGLMTEYNRALTDIPNIYLAPSWAGLSFYLVSKGLLSEKVYS